MFNNIHIFENKGKFENKNKNNNLDLNKENKKKIQIENLKNKNLLEKLIYFQKELKKIISIKNQFKSNINNFLNDFDNLCFQYYQNKLKIKEIYDFSYNKNLSMKFKYKLIKEKFKNQKEIYDLFFILKNNKKLILDLIEKINKNYYDDFSYFLVHFFYENIFNSSFYQEDFMIIFLFLLEKHINLILNKENLNKNKNYEFLYENYLKDSFLNFLIINILRKENIRTYLNSLLNDNFIKLEKNEKKFIISNFDENIIGNYNNNNDKNDNNNNNIEEEFMEILKENITLNFLKENLELKSSKFDDKINKINKEYIKTQINRINSLDNFETFSNETYVKNLKEIKEKKDEKYYENYINLLLSDYKVITEFINNLLNNINNNINSIPYNIKCMCKILDLILETKIENKIISEYEKIMFLISFFFKNIIYFIINNPDHNGLISTFILSKNTKHNLKIINKILEKLFTGKLFEFNNLNNNENDLIIFNNFLLKTTPKIFEFIYNIKSLINLSKEIQKEINNEIKINLKEINVNLKDDTPLENIKYESVCFNFNDLSIILNVFKENFDYFNKNFPEISNLIEKIKNYDYDILFKEDYNNLNIKYFYFTKIEYLADFLNKINKLENENFLINNNEEDIKNSIFNILKYVKELNDFPKIIFSLKNNNNNNNNNRIFNLYEKNQIKNEEKNSNKINLIDDIFPLILNNIKLELNYNNNSDFLGKILVSFYLIFKNNLNKNLTEEDYNKIINELITEIENYKIELNSIFDILKNFVLNKKDLEKLNMLIMINLNQLKQYRNFLCVEILYEKIDLPFEILIDKENENLIKNIQINFIENKEKNIKSKIEEFIENFPNINNIKFKENDILTFQENINLHSTFKNYINNIKKNIKNFELLKLFNKEEISEIIIDLEDFILLKLYKKIYPKFIPKKDYKIWKKCERIKNFETKNLLKNYNFKEKEKLFETAIKYFNSMDECFSPLKKIVMFDKGKNIIENTISFNSGKNELGIDDSINLLLYVILKSSPKRFYSNFYYGYLYLNSDLAKKKYGQNLALMEMILAQIEQFTKDDFIIKDDENFGNEEDDLKGFKDESISNNENNIEDNNNSNK